MMTLIPRPLRSGYAAAALAAAAAVGFAAWAIDRSEAREDLAARRLHVQGDLSSVRARLEMELNSRIHLAHGLEALAAVKPQLSREEFQTVARVLQEEHDGIRSLQLARDGVVSHVFPEAGNEAALGHSLLKDPLTAQAARNAIATRSLSLAGPYTLRQGGEGLVARVPVFVANPIARDESFWGFATVIIDFPTLLRASGMADIEGTEFALRGRDGTGGAGAVFHGSTSTFGGDHIAVEVRFPNGSWLLAARPVGGWDKPWPGRGWFLLVTALVLAAIPVATVAIARASRLRRESETLRLRDRLLNSMAEGVYALDVSGRCTFVNAAALRALQFGREEIIGADPAALFGGPACSGVPGPSFEWRLRRRDGTSFPAEINVDAVEQAPGYVVAFSDITERRIAEERLRLAATVFARTQQGIVITDAEARIVDVNPAFTEITGYAREDALGRTPRLLRSGRHGPEFYAEMRRSLGATGFWRGEIWNRHKTGLAYPELLSIAAVDDEHGAVTHYIGVFSDISRQKQQEVDLARIAHFDALTGLPNRTLLTERFSQALERARLGRGRVAVGMLDLDRFKAINDRHGHDAGDIVLTETASRLRATLRPADTVARLGGDEFVLLLEVDGVAACDSFAHRLLGAVAAPIRVGSEAVSVTASLGITIYPEDASDADTLLRHADQAMYAAKDSGRNGFRLFDAEQDRQARTHRETLERIGAAIAGGEFRLHYQPKVDMRAGRVVGFEALARWQHPSQGLLGPSEFLRVIEGTELDVQLGRWVLAEALNQLAEWRAGGLHVAISVNVSVTQLLAPGFTDELRALLRRHPMIGPDALEIEVLENAAILDLDAASEVLRACLDIGVSVALDDFGTGYSSLAYFRRLPVKTIKIDQIFVRDMLEDADDMAIVEGIIRFARAFDCQLVAEGVQHAELGLLLLAMGCDIAQGYGIARPMPAERVLEWCGHFRPNAEWAAMPRCHSEHLALVAAELQHGRWVDEICASLLRGPGGGTPPALDSRECSFGRWFDANGAARLGPREGWAAVVAAHESLHDLAAEIASAPPSEAAAAARIAELTPLRDELVRSLRALRRREPLGAAQG